ncbi:DDE-type integrase/transposase/recombinase [Leptolyngbya sp. FACHB-671]|uniref:Mu transposase C-terminal domain-containing protein n=1 Tax=Leptolyngbya sp. FACHB-671 TaxID=2692812 RepID=UPI0016881C76|nr:Mu transposase C-terminal domain-containing protein [Leptolyngbya sp. FACHB-671]MBD2069807.1 DDE-type integrase/transposase/recombinase [Leptolyngbya sp. FACHB-671]
MKEVELVSPALPLTQVSTLAAQDGRPVHRLLAEEIEDLDKRRFVMRKLDAIEDIIQTSDDLKQERIQLWADRLERHPRTITRWLEKAQQDGLAAIAREVRSDAGQLKGNKRWKHSLQYWTEFILNTYNDGVKAKLGMTRNLTFNQVKAHAELELGLKEGEYPCHVFVYAVLDPIIEAKNRKVRNPGQGPGIIIKVINDEGEEEDIVVERSNQVWQIDHTRLDNLLADEEGGLTGSVWITAVIDTWSSCVMGYYLSFDSAGSHEVALALRHAILPKQYGPEYQLQKEWEAGGLPEYIVTDRAKEFKSAHLKHVASALGIKLRRRLYKEQGGVVERLFLALKTEFAALTPGFKGGSLQERPDQPEKYACVVFEDYDRKLVRHLVDHHNQHLYPRVANQTLSMRWQAGLPGLKPRMPESERSLDICLMKSTKRKVQERGCVEFRKLICTASLSRDEEGNWQYDKTANFLKVYEGREVMLLYNPTNIVYILVYSLEENGQPAEYLGTIRARDWLGERLSFREWEAMKKKIRDEGNAIDQSSILAEQRDSYNDSIKQVKTMRQRRRSESRRLTKASPHSDKVVELHPPQAASANSTKSKRSKSKKVESEVESAAPEPLESVQEQVEVSVNPALYVVSDWNEFVEDSW